MKQNDVKMTIAYCYIYKASCPWWVAVVLAIHYHYQPTHIVDEWYFCARLPTAHQWDPGGSDLIMQLGGWLNGLINRGRLGIWLELTIFSQLTTLCGSFNNWSLALLFSVMHWYDECDDGKTAIERLQCPTTVAFIWLLWISSDILFKMAFHNNG